MQTEIKSVVKQLSSH